MLFNPESRRFDLQHSYDLQRKHDLRVFDPFYPRGRVILPLRLLLISGISASAANPNPLCRTASSARRGSQWLRQAGFVKRKEHRWSIRPKSMGT